MIKGCQKQMIVLRTGGNRYFDEAYFVLRREIPPLRGGDGDILVEANRILEETALPYRRTKRRDLRGGIGFLLGAVSGAAVCTLIFLLL